jgi:hypothetical protein
MKLGMALSNVNQLVLTCWKVFNDWTLCLQDKCGTTIVYVDFSKALHQTRVGAAVSLAAKFLNEVVQDNRKKRI